MLSHHQFSLSKPCESYQHVKDGVSWALLENPRQTDGHDLLLCGHLYKPGVCLQLRCEAELNLREMEHVPAWPLQEAADEQLLGWSHSLCVILAAPPLAAALGYSTAQNHTRAAGERQGSRAERLTFHHPGGKDTKCTLLPLKSGNGKSFSEIKKKYASSFSAQK